MKLKRPSNHSEITVLGGQLLNHIENNVRIPKKSKMLNGHTEFLA